MRNKIGYLCFALFILVAIFRIYSNIIFKQELGGHLKRAADANTVELALTELKTSLKYIEDNNLTSGYTSVLYETPDEDLSFWYTNIKASAEELEKSKGASLLEKTNVLLKLRESLMDDGSKGSRTTYPQGLSIYPYNKEIAILFLISLLFLPILFVEVVKYDKEEKLKLANQKNSEGKQ